MRTLKTMGAFDKAFKKVRKYNNFKQDKFDKAISKLRNGEPLDVTYKDHKAVKHSDREYQGSRIFHAAPDIVVIYQLTDDSVILQNIGKHNDLFENLI